MCVPTALAHNFISCQNYLQILCEVLSDMQSFSYRSVRSIFPFGFHRSLMTGQMTGSQPLTSGVLVQCALMDTLKLEHGLCYAQYATSTEVQ